MPRYRLQNGRLNRISLACDRLEDRTTPTVLDLTAAVGSQGSFGVNGYTGAGVHEGTINGALFQQSLSNNSTGTGIFPSFVQIQHKDIEQGYNYDAANLSAQFDEHNDPPHNHLVQLGDVPVITVGGIEYRTFRLDLHEAEGQTNELLSLDELRIFLTANSPVQDAYNLADNTITTADGAFSAIYDLDNPTGPAGDVDNWILLDSTLSAGSGKGDMLALIPNSLFTGADARYVTLYSKFGVHGSTIPGADTSATFEEWSYILLGDGHNFPDGGVEIGGTKFEDSDGNLGTDGDQHGISWTVHISGPNGLETDVPTANDGTWSYSMMSPGTYTVTEVQQDGWTQLGNTSSYSVTVDADGKITNGSSIGNDFFNFHNVVISGTKWEDHNGNGVRDDGDQGLSDWHILVNGVDTGVVTGTDGSYSISVGPNQTVTLQEAQSGQPWGAAGSGFTETYGTAGYGVTVGGGGMQSGGTSTGNDFGNFKNVSIGGFKYYDANRNGIFDSGLELKLSGWTIILDDNGNGTVDLGEKSATTDANGNWSIDNVGPGTHKVTEILQPGWTQSGAPAPFTPSSGVNVTELNFGNYNAGESSGLTIGFWSNKNGATEIGKLGTWASVKATLATLNLRNSDGSLWATSSNADSVTKFQSWLNGATATNMPYMLSAQLAATKLDTWKSNSDGRGQVFDSEYVYVGTDGVNNPLMTPGNVNVQGASLTSNLDKYNLVPDTKLVKISDLITAAANALRNSTRDPNAPVAGTLNIPSGNPDRSYFEALKIVLDSINNSKIWVYDL